MYKFLVEKYIFTICAYDLFKVKILPEKHYKLYLGQNTSKYFSQIINVDLHANGFKRVTVLQTVSNQEDTLKRLISMLPTA